MASCGRFADVNVVNRVPHGGVMVWAGLSYGQRTQLHFIIGNLYAQRYHDEILRPIVVPLFRCHRLMFQHDNAWPHSEIIYTQFLEAVPVPPWPAYSPYMLPNDHARDTLHRHVWQRVPVPANINQLRTAIEEEWDNITQATINRCVMLHEANGGHTRYWLVFWSTILSTTLLF